MNIYLNFNFIIECLKIDERGDANTFEFLKSICDGLNKALGGINNLEPIIDETDNTLKIVDTTPIPGYSSRSGSKPYTLQLFGYEKLSSGYISNFIRKVDLKTAITPEFATMVTIGATAGGYVKGTEATAFSKWNLGLTDRFKEEFEPGNPASVTPPGGVDEAESNYQEKISSPNGYAKRYGFTTLNKGYIKLSDDIIEGNISIGTEYFKYIIAKNKNTSGGTIGFIPFKISFTMDGLSGIKIYNKLNVDTRFLPKAYGDNLDLIVTGVSHKLANNDWETDIEATVIPKTSGNITISYSTSTTQVSGSAPGNTSPGQISNCSQLPPQSGISSTSAKIVKPSTIDDWTLIHLIVDNLEGGYYHPTQGIYRDGTINPDFSAFKDSGETMFGLDRYAGNIEGIRQGPKNQNGIEFWEAMDKISGNGKYASVSRNTPQRSWDIKKYPKLKKSWENNFQPAKGSSGYGLLHNRLYKLMKGRYTSYLNSYFKSNPTVKNLVETDGRLKFMYYRATWNGGEYFRLYAKNLIATYENGERNIDKLICADLTYRYNTKADVFKPGVSKLSYMMDYNP